MMATMIARVFVVIVPIYGIIDLPYPRYYPPEAEFSGMRRALVKDAYQFDLTKNMKDMLAADIGSKSYYDPGCKLSSKCGVVRQFKVVPVYFWPQTRLEIPCTVCAKSSWRNGQIKQWRMLTADKMLNIFNEQKRNDFSAWITIGDLEVKIAKQYEDCRSTLHNCAYNLNNRGEGTQVKSHEEFKWGEFEGEFHSSEWNFGLKYFTRGFDKKQRIYESSKSASYSFDTHKDRTYHDAIRPGKTTFYQRNGKLVIINAQPDIQGAYNCYDTSVQDKVQMIHLLMSMVPVYLNPPNLEAFWGNGMNRVPQEPLACHRYNSGRNSTSGLSYNWLWRFLPTQFYKEHQGPMYGEAVSHLTFLEQAHAMDSNLALLVEWSPWSPYSHAKWGVRTRQGHCHIEKKIMTKPVEHFEKKHVWVNVLLEFFQYFSCKGVRIHSGILYDVILRHYQPELNNLLFIHCGGSWSPGEAPKEEDIHQRNLAQKIIELLFTDKYIIPQKKIKDPYATYCYGVTPAEDHLTMVGGYYFDVDIKQKDLT